MKQRPASYPAFPTTPVRAEGGKMDPDCYSGLSTREYYAAHAPLEIPEWFDWHEPAAPIQADTTPLDIEARSILNGWKNKINCGFVASIEELPTELQSYGAAHLEYLEAIRAHSRECPAGRYFAWRWHYADMMLEISTHQPKE